MQSLSGTGDASPAVALYTVTAPGLYAARAHVTSGPTNINVTLSLNNAEIQVARSPALPAPPVAVPLVLAAGDVLKYRVIATGGGAWGFDFTLHDLSPPHEIG